MANFIYTLFYILLIGEIIWWFTCVNRKDIPLILEILGVLISIIPGVHIGVAIIFPISCIFADIEFKDNWFNRKFLSYHDE